MLFLYFSPPALQTLQDMSASSCACIGSVSHFPTIQEFYSCWWYCLYLEGLTGIFSYVYEVPYQHAALLSPEYTA